MKKIMSSREKNIREVFNGQKIVSVDASSVNVIRFTFLGGKQINLWTDLTGYTQGNIPCMYFEQNDVDQFFKD